MLRTRRGIGWWMILRHHGLTITVIVNPVPLTGQWKAVLLFHALPELLVWPRVHCFFLLVWTRLLVLVSPVLSAWQPLVLVWPLGLMAGVWLFYVTVLKWKKKLGLLGIYRNCRSVPSLVRVILFVWPSEGSYIPGSGLEDSTIIISPDLQLHGVDFPACYFSLYII